jgi:hypothetical protein
MNKMLKRTLIQYIQAMDHHFMCLDLSIDDATCLQIHSLETLGGCIDDLRNLVEVLPISELPVSSTIRHGLYNQLTIIGGFAQLMMHKQAGLVEQNTIHHLNHILETGKSIEVALQSEKATNTLNV